MIAPRTRAGVAADVCSAVYFQYPDGRLSEFQPLGHVAAGQTFDPPAGTFLLGCRVQITRRPAVKIRKDIQELLELTKAAPPLALAGAGYIWHKAAGDTAVPLIAAVGLQVSA